MQKISVILLVLALSLSAGARPKVKSTPANRAAPVARAEETPNPRDLIKKNDWQTRGKTFESLVTMRVVRGDVIRKLEIQLWAKGTEKSLVKVIAPERERANGMLRLGIDFWNFAPSVDRVQKISPSMMKLAWMGADFSNGDLVRSTNLSRYYEHRITGQEPIDGRDSYRIESHPRRGAPVEDGKIVTWLTRAETLLVRQEYFGGDGKLERTVVGKNFQHVGDHFFPGTLVVTKAGETGSFTQIDYRAVQFDRPIAETTFTQEFLRKRIENPYP